MDFRFQYRFLYYVHDYLSFELGIILQLFVDQNINSIFIGVL